MILLSLLHGCITTGRMPAGDRTLVGQASWYGEEFAGRTTANGEIFDPFLLTAAHRSLPFGTLLEVRNQTNGRVVKVRVNDRGPFVGNRILDLSYAAAKRIGMVEAGVQVVQIRVLEIGTNERVRRPPVVARRDPPAKRTPLDPSTPPPIDFPTPEDLRRRDSRKVVMAEEPSADSAVLENVAVEEYRAGTRVRKEVSADGSTIVEQPVIVRTPAAAETRTHSGRVPTLASAAGSSAGRFLLQLGAFSSKENAEQFQAHVRTITEKSYIEEDGVMFRVRVGPFTNKIEAIEARERVEMNGISAMLLSIP